MMEPGTRVGPYEIAGKLGAGGMGEVYRARDTRLGRDVAIKVLPEMFASDPERLARFEREAQVLASLNHPHIAHIYGVEQGALVMELVEGETLADRVARGPLPVDEALAIARQIADGLGAAHEAGIIHRDLKPANIRLRPDGTVKVLDFGLAKLSDPNVPNDSKTPHALSLSPTITSPVLATGIGTLLGTAVYMSPEQAKGRAADKRADVWAFGCVLFEMLTGRRVFDGENVTETLAAVLMKEPDFAALPPSTPRHVVRLLQRCLRKDPRKRIQDIGDVRLDLDESGDAAPAPVAAPPRRLTWLPWAIAAVMAIAAGVAWWARPASPAPSSIVRFAVAPPPGLRIGSNVVALSPDGSHLAMVLRRGVTSQIYVRALDEQEPHAIGGADGSWPFFSADGRSIAFSAKGALYRLGIGGGTALRIAESAWGTGTWGPDDSIIYTPSYASGLWRVPANGGTPEKLTDPDTKAGELGHWYPQFLPDGKSVLVTLFHTPADTSTIAIYSLDTHQMTVVARNGYFARYVFGHLLFMRSATLMAVPFDVDRRQTIGNPVAVLQNVASTPSDGRAGYAVSENGSLAYLSATSLFTPQRLVYVGQDGKAGAAVGEPGVYDAPAVSPDGRRVAVMRDPESDIWLFAVDRGVFTRATYTMGSEVTPRWAPDSRRLFFSHEEPVFQIYTRNVDEGAPPVRLTNSPNDQIATDVTPDGKFLIVQESSPQTNNDLWMMPVGGGTRQVLLQTPFAEGDGHVSPDGRWLSYASNETGRSEVYVQAFPGGGQRIQVSTAGGAGARWARDGRTLYYREGDKVMAVTFAGTPSLSVSRPVMRAEFPELGGFDAAPDGRLVALVGDRDAAPAPAYVVVNWLGELKSMLAGR